LRAVFFGYLVGQQGTHHPVDVNHWQFDADLLGMVDSRLRLANDFVVERQFQQVILLDGLHGADIGTGFFRRGEDTGQIDTAGLPVVDCAVHFQHVAAAHHLADGAKTQFRHDFPQIFRQHKQVVDHVLGFALELGAGVEVTLAHHDAAEGNQRRGGKAKFFGPQQRGDGHIAAGLQLAVRLQHHAGAQVVHHQSLVRFGQAQLPG